MHSVKSDFSGTWIIQFRTTLTGNVIGFSEESRLLLWTDKTNSVSGDVQGSMEILPQLSHATHAHNKSLLSGVSSSIPLEVISGTRTAHWLVDDILRTVLLPIFLRHSAITFALDRPYQIWRMQL